MINKMILEAEAETEMERVSHLREELEKEHDLAISRLKRLYTSQLNEVIEDHTLRQMNLEQTHHDQVMLPIMLNATSGSFILETE